MIRKKKMFEKPRKAYEKSRIEEENRIVERYGLKNKREVWKTLSKVNYFRSRAKELAKLGKDEQEVLFNKLRAIGLNTSTIADVLALKVEDLLERRLPTILVKKKLANTTSQARQMVSHKRVLVDRKIINIPSYLVPVSQEGSITLKEKKMASKTTEISSADKEQIEPITETGEQDG